MPWAWSTSIIEIGRKPPLSQVNTNRSSFELLASAAHEIFLGEEYSHTGAPAPSLRRWICVCPWRRESRCLHQPQIGSQTSARNLLGLSISGMSALFYAQSADFPEWIDIFLPWSKNEGKERRLSSKIKRSWLAKKECEQLAELRSVQKDSAAQCASCIRTKQGNT